MLGRSRPILSASGIGGLLAIMYAGTYPDQVMGLLRLDGSLPTDDAADRILKLAEGA